MTTRAPARPITAEDFLHMPESEGAELVDGRIVGVPMGSISSWIGGELLFLIRAFMAGQNIGWVFPQETGLAIWPEHRNRVRKPDLTFIRAGRLPGGRLPQGWLTVVPDLVVEIVSPKDRVEDLDVKLSEYREAGIPLIWVIFPGTRSAHVLGANLPLREVNPDGSLDGGDTLPGFSCKLSELFTAAEMNG